MKLERKKELAARSLGIGKTRLVFNPERLDEIKEAITKQDIRDLLNNRAIIIKEIKGRRKVRVRKMRRGVGSVRKKVLNKKTRYVKLTRKLRSNLSQARKKGMSREKYIQLRKEIKASAFKNLAHLRERFK